VSRAKGIEFALPTVRKTADTIVTTVRAELFLSASQYLMAVRLMTYIPNQLVVRGVENVMDGHRQLYYPQTRPKVTGMLGRLLNDEMPEFIAQLR
jgi:hypothetical protein